MKPVHIIALVVRLFAVFLVFYALRDLIAVVLVSNDPVANQRNLPLYSVITASLLVSGLLWFFPLSIASKLFPYKLEKLEKTKIELDELYSLGFILLGSYLLFDVISDSMFWLIFWYLGSRESSDYITLRPEDISSMVVTIFEFILSVLLILNSRGISRVIRNLRGRVDNSSNK